MTKYTTKMHFITNDDLIDESVMCLVHIVNLVFF